MNIFYLHDDPIYCAQMHCDKHVVKMILEYAQLLSTAHHEIDGTPSIDCYKPTHKTIPLLYGLEIVEITIVGYGGYSMDYRMNILIGMVEYTLLSLKVS